MYVYSVGCGLFATSWSLVQKSSTGWVPLIMCDLGTSTVRRPRPEFSCWATKKN